MILQTSWNAFLNASGALENMTQFTEELSRNQDRYGSRVVDSFRAQVVLSNVTFSYSDKAVLKGINLTIQKNETIAFVGASGSGKTTLVNILAGLLPVSGGEMTIDGSPSQALNMLSWHRRIGYITQEPVIFSDSVFNNVTFWSDHNEANLTRFWAALEKSAIADFVRQLPDGEDAHLGDAGVLISGGQKQRLSIARELYKDIDILIMDEATSSLDSETELAIQDNIDSLRGQYTILIIAHRLATIKNADRIVLLNEGSIFGIGDFQSLIDQSTPFSRMVSLQGL
jgi:subfamily B ATP-binding cassette protein MsbA